jgi:hypothetical protein
LYSNYATNWKSQGLDPGSGKLFFSASKHPVRLWDPQSLLFSGNYSLFPGLHWLSQTHEADHSPPAEAEVKNELSYTPTPLCAFMLWGGKSLLFFYFF